MTVVRDCTGMYLRFEGKDYHVCNEESFSSIADGTRVTATFEKTGSCKPIEDRVVCKLLHLNEGYVKVKKLKIK